MAIIKCKMCGGNLDIASDVTVAECEYCGTQQTVPSADNEKKMSLFSRANRLRLSNEFDKAAGVFETIVADFPEEAEAYWGLVLCRYGIEYVDDPATGKKIPTCHRSSFDSVMSDSDYEQTLENADPYSRRIYREEAKQIEQLRKDIIAASANEEPYDIFICYKETAPDGQRTLDSVLAQDIYDALTDKGYRVFFARITLEDKLGTEYEPVIFAALHSARIMLAVGTDYEYFNAVWVKNEWGRYLKLMEKDREKHLIPCYKGIDAYDMPPEFAKLQAQDLGKVGATQDLLRGVEKILPRKAETVKETVILQQAATPVNAMPLLERAYMFLEDGDFARADEFCEQVLNMDPKNAQAYVGKLMAELKVKKQENLKNCDHSFDGNANYQKAVRFADEELKATLTGYVDFIVDRNFKNTHQKAIAIINAAEKQLATTRFNQAERLRELNETLRSLQSISSWGNARELIGKCEAEISRLQAAEDDARNAEKCRKRNNIIGIVAATLVIAFAILLLMGFVPENDYRNAAALEQKGKYFEAIKGFYALGDYKDSRERCLALWDEIAVRDTISTGLFHTVGLKNDGTVVATGSNSDSQCDVSYWTDIVAISAGNRCTVGLKSDGTVVAVGFNNYGECDVSEWEDIVAISAGTFHTVGLKIDGTVVATGYNDAGQCNVSGWTDIVAISAGGSHTLGLKSDGTVVVAGWIGDQYYSSDSSISAWSDIVAIRAGNDHAVALKADGTVVAMGDNEYGQCDVSSWTDIIAISANDFQTVGLKADGTVVATGLNDAGQCDVSEWEDIVAISTGSFRTIGLKADGTVVAVGSGRGLNITDWTSIKLPNTRKHENV